MPTLTEEANAAQAAVEAAAEAARVEERRALRQAATDAMKQLLVRPDGSSLTMTEVALKPVSTDLAAGVVVYSDGTLYLAATRRELEDGGHRWVIHLVTKNPDGTFTRASERLDDLADLGFALDEVAT